MSPRSEVERTVRKRFTMSASILTQAEAYARADNRTFSELVCEAVRQMMARYPKARKNGQFAGEKSLVEKVADLERDIAQLYTQVKSRATREAVSEVGNDLNGRVEAEGGLDGLGDAHDR